MDALAGVDGIVLAGFLSILPGEIIQAFSGRIINIHPSLLPKYGGRGMYGLKVHARVLAEGDQVSGCTCHLVTEEVDGGEILLAKAVPVLKTDTPETLQARILPFEHEVIVQGLLKLIAKLEGGDTIKNEGAMRMKALQNKSTCYHEYYGHESTMKKEITMKNALISVFDKTKWLSWLLIARWNIISAGLINILKTMGSLESRGCDRVCRNADGR